MFTKSALSKIELHARPKESAFVTEWLQCDNRKKIIFGVFARSVAQKTVIGAMKSEVSNLAKLLDCNFFVAFGWWVVRGTDGAEPAIFIEAAEYRVTGFESASGKLA